MQEKKDRMEEFFAATQPSRVELPNAWIEASQNFGFLEAATGLGHKNIVKIIFRHRKRKYAPVGAKSLIT